MAIIEPTISIADFKRRYRPSNPNFATDRRIKEWIMKGKIRGRRSPEWCVYEDWEPRQETAPVVITGDPLIDKMLGYDTAS